MKETGGAVGVAELGGVGRVEDVGGLDRWLESERLEGFNR